MYVIFVRLRSGETRKYVKSDISGVLEVLDGLDDSKVESISVKREVEE